MKEDYASYELAVKLKACGFDEPCRYFYSRVDVSGGLVSIGGDDRFAENYNGEQTSGSPIAVSMCSMPSLYAAQKWLREKWGIYAYCEPNCLKKWFARAIDLTKNEDLLFDGEMFDNFEKATEYAISAALELIKKGE